MSYVKTFMEDYLRQEKFTIPIKYIIYNSQTRQFRSSNISSSKQQCEYVVQVLNNEDEFTIFISHPIDDEYFCPKGPSRL